MFAPNSTIRLMKGVPLDSTYRNTIWFDNIEEQTKHFMSTYDYKLFSNQTYQRYGRGTLRISALADELYDYNYIAFRNNVNGTQGKIFYCFINSVEYIAERTTEIRYEIDYMQTYFFDYSLGDCFVEREHSVTDEIGDNLVPEGLDCGELVAANYSMIDELTDLDMCVASTSYTIDGNVVDTDGEIYNGLFSGQRLTHFPMDVNGINQLRQFLGTLTEKAKSDGITSLFLVSRHIANLSNEPIQQTEHKVNKIYGIRKTDGKLPNNNKLFTFPYCMLYVTNMQGESAIYPYEYFADNECVFYFFGDYSPMPSVILYPFRYKGILQNYDEKLTLTGYPQLSFNIDTYKAYIAQNSGKIVSQAVNTTVDIGKNIASTAISTAINPISGVTGALSTGANALKDVTSTIGAYRDLAVKPPHSVGGVSISLAFASEKLLNFQFIHKHIRPEYVDIIDGYFDMYGYSTHKVKIPNTHSRPFWNYVKTSGCNIFTKNTSNGLPSLAIERIKNIYDNGITFWNKSAVMGDYTQDNKPR